MMAYLVHHLYSLRQQQLEFCSLSSMDLWLYLLLLDVFASRRTVSYTFFFDPLHHYCVFVSLDVFPYSFDLSWYVFVISKLLFLFVLQVRVFPSMLWFSR